MHIRVISDLISLIILLPSISLSKIFFIEPNIIGWCVIIRSALNLIASSIALLVASSAIYIFFTFLSLPPTKSPGLSQSIASSSGIISFKLSYILLHNIFCLLNCIKIAIYLFNPLSITCAIRAKILSNIHILIFFFF